MMKSLKSAVSIHIGIYTGEVFLFKECKKYDFGPLYILDRQSIIYNKLRLTEKHVAHMKKVNSPYRKLLRKINAWVDKLY